MYQSFVCEYESIYKFNVDRHEKAKHLKPNSISCTISNNVTPLAASETGEIEQTVSPHSQNAKHSNLQEHNVDQLYDMLINGKKHMKH